MNSPPHIPLPLMPEDYLPHVNEDFLVHCGEDGNEAARPLRLLSVKVHIDDDIQRSFSLEFFGAGALFEQQTRRVTHPGLGEFDLFLVPVGRKKDGFLYEAVFNRLKEAVE